MNCAATAFLYHVVCQCLCVLWVDSNKVCQTAQHSGVCGVCIDPSNTHMMSSYKEVGLRNAHIYIFTILCLFTLLVICVSFSILFFATWLTHFILVYYINISVVGNASRVTGHWGMFRSPRFLHPIPSRNNTNVKSLINVNLTFIKTPNNHNVK